MITFVYKVCMYSWEGGKMKSAKKIHTVKFNCPFCFIRGYHKIKNVDVLINNSIRCWLTILRKGIYMKRIIIIFLALIFLPLSSCTNTETVLKPGSNTTNMATAKNGYRIAYLCSDASDFWLAHVAKGIKDTCTALGIEYIFVDCRGRDDLFLSFIKDIENRKLDALIVSPTNEGLGPMVTSKCSEIGIPLLCIESRLKTTEGKNAAYIGNSAYECGMTGGRELAKRALDKGFFKSDRPVTVILLSRINFFYEDQMMQGFQDAFKTLLPGLRAEDYVFLETYHSLFPSQYIDIKNQLKELDQSRRYIGVSYNDDGALALYRFAYESGIDLNNIFICGMGGYDPSYDIFSNGGKGAENYITLGINPFEIGEKAVHSLYSNINRGEELLEMQTVQSTLLTSQNYKEYFHKTYGSKITTDTMKYDDENRR